MYLNFGWNITLTRPLVGAKYQTLWAYGFNQWVIMAAYGRVWIGGNMQVEQ